jgi:hypothetical protein
MKFLLLLLLVPTYNSTAQTMDDVEWKAACYGLAMTYAPAWDSCKNLAPPIVVETRILDKFVPEGYILNGMFIPGETIIMVNPRTESKSGTRIHEAVHYILYWSGQDVTRCESEELARQVAGQPWSTKMRQVYKCPIPL